MKPERLTEIRKIAERGDLTAPEHIVRGLRELLVYVDEMAGEYTADPPPEKREAQFDSLSADDIVFSRDRTFKVAGWTSDRGHVRLTAGDGGHYRVAAEEWLDNDFEILRRAALDPEAVAEKVDEIAEGARKERKPWPGDLIW